jgi:hypothetical protein
MLHVVVALARVGQAFPHIPQCEGDSLRLASQPLDALPSQSAKPGLQVKPQLPALHVVVALARVGQAFPHIPQCEGDMLRSTQVVPQRVSEPHPLTH